MENENPEPIITFLRKIKLVIVTLKTKKLVFSAGNPMISLVLGVFLL